jgi:5S rRNA maturation endonuclease (ribonuclease M5)
MGIEHEELEVEKARATSAQHELQVQYSRAMEASVEMQERAGGIDPKGAQRALAAAFTAQSKAHSESISNAASILSHYNYGDDIITEIAMKSKKARALNINLTDDIQEAAILHIAGGGNAKEIQNLVANIELDPSEKGQDIRQALSDALKKNAAKPKYVGMGSVAEMQQGILPVVNGKVASGKQRLDYYVANTINANKLDSAEALVTQDAEYLKTIAATLDGNESGVEINTAMKQQLIDSLYLARKDAQYAGRIGERKEHLDSMENKLRSEGFIPKEPEE